jgi:hypothetical protein
MTCTSSFCEQDAAKKKKKNTIQGIILFVRVFLYVILSFSDQPVVRLHLFKHQLSSILFKFSPSSFIGKNHIFKKSHIFVSSQTVRQMSDTPWMRDMKR